MKRTFYQTATILTLFFAGICPARSESFSEPPLVIYGKVIQAGPGASYQLFSGELSLSLVDESDPTHVLTKKIKLGPVGANGAFSYRVEIPLKHLPTESDLTENLGIGREPSHYRFDSLTIDGIPAELLDSTVTGLIVQFSKRAAEQRIDLKSYVPVVDSDGDGIPDWWEDRYGLNRFDPLDAAADPDGDGLSNLQEFLLGTDPNTPNFDPIVKTTNLSVPSGGRAGLHLLIVDQNTDPSNLVLVIHHSVPGLKWYRRGIELAPAQNFSYAEVLAGDIAAEATIDFHDTAVDFGLTDQTGSGVETPFTLQASAFSPNNLLPAVWLHAGALESNGPIAEWSDASGSSRDGYQPSASAQPIAVAGQNARFSSPQFLYVDDRNLSLSSFTAFLSFDVAATSSADQTLFSSPDLQLRVGGDLNPESARSLQVIQAGKMIQGPVVEQGHPSQLTLQSSLVQSFLIGPDQNYYTSIPSAVAPLSTFTTIGALQRLSDNAAVDFLQGGVRELVLFDRALEAKDRARVEDYQRARWDGWLLWGDPDETLPLTIHGSSQFNNLITGGWGDDSLTGGPLADIIRGGPGADHLTGASGADRFEFLPNSGNDTITDFSPDDGDVIDLTSLFGDLTGTPGQYINIRAQVTRGTDNVPVVNSLLELDYNGDGSGPDQVITLQGLSIGNSDLPRLVGEGTILLGGPKFETSIVVTTPQTNLIRDNIPHAIKVSRTGNLDAAMKINLSFAGTAMMDHDYRIEGVEGTGTVRTVTLAREQSEAIFRLVPIGQSVNEEESIAIQVLPSPVITEAPQSPLLLTLHNASFVSIHTLRHFEDGTNTTGLVEITRTGSLEQQIEIPLILGGNLVNGQDVEPLPSSITLAPGQNNRQLEIRLRHIPGDTNQVNEIQIGLHPDPSHYALSNPTMTSVLVLPDSGQPALSYAEWQKLSPSNVGNLMAYLTGNDSSPDAGKVTLQNVDGYIELRFTTIAGLTDVAVSVLGSGKLSQWEDVTGQFSISFGWLPNGHLQTIYRSLERTDGAQQYYRISARPL